MEKKRQEKEERGKRGKKGQIGEEEEKLKKRKEEEDKKKLEGGGRLSKQESKDPHQGYFWNVQNFNILTICKRQNHRIHKNCREDYRVKQLVGAKLDAAYPEGATFGNAAQGVGGKPKLSSIVKVEVFGEGRGSHELY